MENENEETWDRNMSVKVVPTVRNRLVQDGAAALRLLDEETAKRIANNPEYKEQDDLTTARGLGWLTDAFITGTTIDKAIVPALAGAAGMIGASVKPEGTTGLGPLNSVTDVVMTYPNGAKAIVDVGLTDVLKTGRLNNKGEENDYHVWDAITGFGGAATGAKLFGLGEKEMEYLLDRIATKAASKGTQFFMSDTKGLSNTSLKEMLKRATSDRYMD